jgi:carboxymethylenebutenolidase
MSYATVTVSDGTFDVYVARPAQHPARGIVVVIQEIFGVNAVMRAVADGYALDGYLAVCPDLFWRIEPGVDITDKSEAEWQKAFSLYRAFDVASGVADIQATLTWARGQFPGLKAGAVGYCLGGLLAFLTAARTDADAAISYYGVGIEGHLDELANVRKPLLLHVAAADKFVPPAAQAAIAAGVAGHAQVSLHIYDGLDHAFARVGGEHFDAAGADLANARTRAFFAAHLEG